MDIVERLISGLPISDGAKLALGFGVALLCLGGYVIAVPGFTVLPVIGGTYQASGGVSGMERTVRPSFNGGPNETSVGVGVRKPISGPEFGLKTFRVEEGQQVVFDYDLKSPCRSLRVSLNLTGVLRDLPSGQRLSKTVAREGKGRFAFTAPQTDAYRVFYSASAYEKAVRDCDVRFSLRWRVAGAEDAVEAFHRTHPAEPESRAAEQKSDTPAPRSLMRGRVET